MFDEVKVLIVDDEAPLRDVLTVRLEHWGYECRAAGDVAEAESLMTAFDPDVVLSDVLMPGVTGLDLLRRLKAAGRRQLPVVLMTAHGTCEVFAEAARLGAVIAQKPFDMGDLAALVERTMRCAANGRLCSHRPS